MANDLFTQTNVGVRERPVSGDLNAYQSALNRTVRELHMRNVGQRTSNSSPAMTPLSSYIGDGLRAVPSGSPAMTVVVSAGVGFIYDPIDIPSSIGTPDIEGLNDLAPFKPSFLNSPVTFAVPAAPGVVGQSRIDIIEAKIDRRLEDSTPREQLDIPTRTFNSHIFTKALAYGYDGRTGTVTNPTASTAGLSYKIGTAGTPGLAPSTTAGYVKIAEILVPQGTTSITGAAIVDRRRLQCSGGVASGSVSWRQRYNAGTPIVDILSVCAPPGVTVAVEPQPDIGGGDHSCGNFMILGGEISRATVRLTASQPTSAGALPPVATIAAHAGGSGGLVATVVTGTTFGGGAIGQSHLVGGGTSAGLGQKAAGLVYTAFLQDASDKLLKVTLAGLDDLIWQANFDLSYH
jgi:hypothetical protein